MAQLLPYRGDYYLWKYVPNVGAAALFIILFLIMTGLHAWRAWVTSSRFCCAFTIGSLVEVIGHIGRALAVKRTDKLMPCVLQSFFTLVAPALFAASIYMVLGRIVRSVHGEHHSIIKVTRLTKVFVLGDIMAFMIQGGSSGLMFNTSTAKIGENIVLVGLIVQIMMFGLFVACAAVWQFRMYKAPTPESYRGDVPWRQTLYMLYGVSIAIFARSIFRVVEYVEGMDGYAMRHEWTLYMFDTLPMFIVTVVYWRWYPSRVGMPPTSRGDDIGMGESEDNSGVKGEREEGS
ncbi:RTA1 like protein-domain-containing protein [Amylocarpus encephaloides]|uniref:RTA1 like protein-domain-containing protein n=1 Tax=Amylocarpus encephaloides TaxID=45428 RepID=A0A9P7YHH2_9HELO|nr:RTA1 like protein-domain-containing protein [Amylocarpus encephaloides]